ncbi:MAG: HAMP domain-containing histidine kinase [Bacteroidota bacterium]|nr:HAMP domain-containing histidine kinase [Bacteroidota bacterium]
MLSAKNLSAQQIAALTALPLAIVIAITGYLYHETGMIILIASAVFYLLSYLLIAFMLKRFIYRKLKLIYKLIYQTKATKKEEFYYENILPQKSIDEVKEDVEVWAEHHKDEIELLRSNEIFRKEFLLNLSHELKTPIFAIQGYVDTLLNGALDKPEVNKKFLGNTAKNVSRLVNLINDLDEISKLESGEQLLYKENFIIQDLIKEVCETLSINAEEKQIKCYIKKGCELPLSVYADKEKIRQVLTNLVDNAIKYGKHNGIIEGSAYRIDGKKILIEISDNGAGIAEEFLPRIFERFFRTDHARARKIGGSGLGLSICKHIIEAHGQTMHARSKVDVGSSFGFTLNSAKN